MTKEANEFRHVTVAKELAKLLEDIRLSVDSLVGQTADHNQFMFRVSGVTADLIETILVPQPGVPSRGLSNGEAIELIFGSSDGSYLVRTVVRLGTADGVIFQLGNEVFRLQRRNNFRTAIPVGVKVAYKVQTFKHGIVPPNTSLAAIDLSAGGLRLKWPASGLAAPNENDHLGGTLTLLNGKSLELFGLVKTLLPQSDGSLHVGIEFQNASLRDEQTLLFAAVQIQREHAPRL
jgi:c-di-GMP-binding flagellar brake protein YcgR